MDKLEMIWRLERAMRGVLKYCDDSNGRTPVFQELQDLHLVLLALKLDGIHQRDPA